MEVALKTWGRREGERSRIKSPATLTPTGTTIFKKWFRSRNRYSWPRSTRKHNIYTNYNSALKSRLVYLYASMSNQYYEYIFTSKFTSKPPISRGLVYISRGLQSLPMHARGFDFRSLSVLFVFPLFTEKSVDLRGAPVSIASTLPPSGARSRYLVTRFHSFIYRTEISLISIVRTALMRCLVIHRF